MSSKILLSILMLFSLAGISQTWQTQKITELNFNFEVQFPGAPTIEKNSTATDTTIKMNATYSGVTYYLIATKTKSTEGAVTACTNAMNSTISKAKTVELNSSSTVGGIKSTQVKYISQKDVYVNSQWLSAGNVVYQLMTLKMKEYGDLTSTEKFFASFKVITANERVLVPATNSTSQFKVNDRVEVLYVADGKYYKGTVLKINTNGTYRVTYDGYASTYDEDVTADRMRTLTETTTANTSTTNTTNSSGQYAVNDRVEVLDASQNKWFGAIILKVNADGTYLVAYDGYADTYDETVPASKIQAPTTATTTDKVPYVKAVKGQTISFTGNLSTGSILEDLEWAESSSMACWPGIRNVEFEGNHVGYWFDLPKKSIVRITVTPKSPKTRINIYGYSGFDFKKLPPEVSRCTTCEASHPTWIGEPNLSEPAQPQTIEFNATTRHNFVYFAVAGARGVTSGEYTVTIELI